MKWVLVTGGAKGVGEAISYALASEGHSIAVHYRNSKLDAQRVAEKCRQIGVQSEIIQGDFSTIPDLKTFVENYKNRFNDTKAIIHNVGKYLILPLLETSLEGLSDLFQENFLSPFYITKSLLSSLIASRGSIIHIGETGVAKGGPKREAPAYFMSKEALWQLTRSYALELAPYGVRVNMVSPGILENTIDSETKNLPMKRAGKLEEIASLVAFLLREENHYITGQNIEVAGGFGL